MQKRVMLKRIRTIISEFGSFGAGEVEQNDGQSVGVGQMGSLIALAEHFHSYHAEVEVYDTSSTNCDSIHSYEKDYRDMTKDEVHDILLICEMYVADQLKTEKRIFN
jgi:hypothetical protein